jgi:hypothetical protein
MSSVKLVRWRLGCFYTVTICFLSVLIHLLLYNKLYKYGYYSDKKVRIGVHNEDKSEFTRLKTSRK